MKSREEPPFADDLLWQDDVISRAQLVAVGMTDTWIRARVTSRRWQRLLPGIYLAHNGPVDHNAQVWAGVLYAGAGAAASHQTAAFLHGLVEEQPDKVHIVVPERRRVRAPAPLVIHRAATSQLITMARPPRTTAVATVIDLVRASPTEADAVAVVTRALAKRLVARGPLSIELATRPRVRWRALLNEIVVDGQGIESPLEWRYRRDVERRHGLPEPRRQDVIRAGKTVRRDVYYDEYQLVIELDGRLGHAGAGAFRDAVRDNASAVRGEMTLRFGWADVVTSPCLVARQVAAVLTSRGWPGAGRRCGAGCALVAGQA